MTSGMSKHAHDRCLNKIMKRRVPWKVRIGIGLILIGCSIFGGWRWWMVTRTWVPLDIPISLKQGHMRSPEFKVNVDTGFQIYVEVETKSDSSGVACLTGFYHACQKSGSRPLQASWTITDSGRVVAQGATGKFSWSMGGTTTKARGLGEFVVPKGEPYVLDIDFPDDNSRFDAGRPRLIIENYYGGYVEQRATVFFFAVFLAAIGVGLVVATVTEPARKRREEFISLFTPEHLSDNPVTATGLPDHGGQEWKTSRRIAVWIALAILLGGVSGYLEIPMEWVGPLAFMIGASSVFAWAVRLTRHSKAETLNLSPSVGQNVQWAQRMPLRRPITGLPAFGLAGGMVFAILAILMIMLTGAFEVTPKGLRVHLLKPGQVPQKSDSWTEPLIVSVKYAGPGEDPKLFVNSKETTWEDLDQALKRERVTRKDWVVYVTGDDAVPYQNVANVIDRARSMSAKVYLLTPKK